MATTYLQPHAPEDGKEYDVQCGRCGSSMGFVDCWNCGGGHDPGDGSDEFARACETCDGAGGSQCCLSGEEWCQSHPAPGRENVATSSPEWFEV